VAAAYHPTFDKKVELKVAPPTYSAADVTEIGEARQKFDQAFENFLVQMEAWNEENAPEGDKGFAHFAKEHTKTKTPPSPVHAVRFTTGGGKTQRVIARLARYILARKAAGDTRSYIFLVPTHWLGEHIDDQFRAQGLTAKVYRGLTASDPSIPGNMERPKPEQEQMCLAREKRELAEALHKSVSESCCKFKKERCEFHPEGKGRRKCGYQQQQLGEQPDVWIAAHNMLFHPQKLFGDVAGIVIDEGFAIKSGVYGVGKKKDDEIPGMLLDDIAADGDACPWRKALIEVLREHPLCGL
jgi:hypothetical protein